MPTDSPNTMNIVRVFPLSRGIPKETLSYFSADSYENGSLITVPLRNKKVPAIVVESKNAQESKAAIKSADYSLKKLDPQEGNQLFLPQFITAVERIADHFATSPGAVFYELAPQQILQNPEEISEPNIKELETTNLQAPPLQILQAPPTERYQEYTNLARSAFAKEKSIYITAPTQHDITTIASYFNEGMSEHTYTLHSDLSDTEIKNKWNDIVTSEHPVIVITTPHFLSIPRPDLHAIIVEKEGAGAYKQQYRPFLDMRTVSRYFSETTKAQRISGDSVLRIETLWQYREQAAEAVYPPKFRYQRDIKKLLVDMKQHEESQESDFTLFSEPLLEKLENAEENNSHLFLFTTRKGMYPFTICGDCGETVTCQNCSYPLVVKEKDGERTFVCNACNKNESTERVCQNCGSWKLWPLGIGIDRIKEELKETFSDLPVFQIDSDTTSTTKQAQEAADNFYESDSGILLSTQMGLQYVKEVDTTGIVTLDSLLSLPDVQIHETAFRLLIDLQLKTNDTLIVQTRQSDTEILETALDGNVTSFYRNEIQDRESFEYPPFSTLIKITVKESEQEIKNHVTDIKNKLQDYNPESYSAFTSQQGGDTVRHILLTLTEREWPDEKLIQKLRSLDTKYEINVEPQSLL